jgi:hypothetical protein
VEEPASRYVLVSTQGRRDEAALAAALVIDVDYVAFVGSRRKAKALKAALAEKGVAMERLSKLQSPAGLDLGAITPDEIAISIRAEIVAVRRGRGVGQDLAGTAPHSPSLCQTASSVHSAWLPSPLSDPNNPPNRRIRTRTSGGARAMPQGARYPDLCRQQSESQKTRAAQSGAGRWCR